ncbi:amidase [Usitatibacter palustris]|uniref:Glutamyl-tRNA(Gln) amidotransferase subunit A n=1 Tax=Usitatibacter palustris TaxID=2732487 RepID=A0A6M4HCU0_9PROT|nr:amidase [Usitatibacter palustris]QJR15817.1 Glutamyl-tRNA(Gln) amidotransferase subunit A [Usitatibacter palustris]
MDLTALGLLDALKAFREGRATVMEYVEACCRKVAERDAQVRAWEWFDPQRALAEAEERSGGGILSDLPLFGIPVGVKDIINTRGIPTRMGSPIYANHVPPSSAWVVRRLEALGGLVMGKTVTTEFAYRHPGKTRNPWNPAHTPGGSSSGSAAAVAAGFVPVAIGTQTLGSVIRPAAFCGVVGYKPTFGAISRHGIHPFAPTLDTVGVFARSVGDAAWFAACLMGHDARDEATAVRGALHALRVPLATLETPPRIAVVKTPKWPLATEAQQANFAEAVATLKDAGATVREVPLPRAFDAAWENVMVITSRDAVKSFALIESRHGVRLSPPLLELLERGRGVTPEEYARARTRRDEYRRWLDNLFDGCDAIATIPAPGEAPEGLANTGDATFNSLWTQTALPAVTIPSGRGPRGLPLGLQLVGRYREDERALQVAAWCEKVLKKGDSPLF